MFNLPGGKKVSVAVLGLGLALTGCATDGYGGYGSVSVGTGWYDGYYGPGYYAPDYYGGYYPYGYSRGYVVVPRYPRNHDGRHWRDRRMNGDRQSAVPSGPPVVRGDLHDRAQWRGARPPAGREEGAARRNWRHDGR